MMAKNRHEKVIGIIKAFLVMNKGKWCTASEITDFIVSHNFGLGHYYVSTLVVSSLLQRKNGIFSDIETKKEYTTKRYRYNGND